MTKNFHTDGPPPAGRPWAQAVRRENKHGVTYGIAIGEGSLQVGFVPENDLVRYIVAVREIGEDLDLLQLVIDAADGLPALKHDYERRMAQGRAAENN